MNQSKAQTYLTQLKSLKLFKSAQAKGLGVPQSTLSWLVAKGDIVKIGPDAYHHKDIYIDPDEEEFAAACLIFGDKSVIAGASALFHYNLIEQIPNQIWLLVPSNVTTHKKKYKLIRTKSNLELGVNRHQWFRITTIARTIVDAFRFQTKIGGLEMAIRAARLAIKEKEVTPHELINCAKELGWDKQVLNYWEAITID
jgi:predicted transcriptional regulator of viral defense system